MREKHLNFIVYDLSNGHVEHRDVYGMVMAMLFVHGNLWNIRHTKLHAKHPNMVLVLDNSNLAVLNIVDVSIRGIVGMVVSFSNIDVLRWVY